MAFSRAPRHLFQLLPNGKAESADLRIRFDHLWMFVINGVERKRARKRGRHTYYLSSIPRPKIFISIAPQYSCSLSILSQFPRLLSRLEFLIRSFFSTRVKKRKKQVHIQWINMSIQPISPWIYMNVTRNLMKFIWHFTKDFLWRWRWSKDGQFPRSMARVLTEWSRVYRDNCITRGDYHQRLEIIFRDVEILQRIWSPIVSPPIRYDSRCRRITRCIKKTLYSHPRTREINVRKFIPTVS